MALRSLTDLPNEILQSICFFIQWKDALSLQATCRRFGGVVEEHLLWKHYCQNCFSYWAASHQMSIKLADTSFTEWKQLFRKHRQAEYTTQTTIDGLILNQKARTPKIEGILDLGYDSKDVLIDNYACTSESSDHLARRYWAHVALGCLHRSLAVKEWSNLQADSRKENSVERAVGAFDLFILGNGVGGDIDDIFRKLDNYVSDIRSAHPDIDDQFPRQKASTVAQFLIDRNLVAIPEDREYHSLEHNFLGRALFSQEKNSLPIISVIIYCYVVRQLGLSAAPCGFPLHVHAIVYPPPGVDLEGNTRNPNMEPRALYMDPFRTSSPVPISSLNEQIAFIARNVTPSERDDFLSASGPIEITIRCTRNIFNSLHRANQTSTPSHPLIDPHSARYAALWAHVLLPTNALHLGQHLLALTQLLTEIFPHDVSLLEKYIVPKDPLRPRLGEMSHSIRLEDYEGFQSVKARRPTAAERVKYLVGQVFRHRRFEYTAVVTGWDVDCGASENWIEHMGIDRLPGGRNQAFYHCFVQNDKSIRYVAQENMELLPSADIVPEDFPLEIGKWFLRWDASKLRFVSNIREEYPDD